MAATQVYVEQLYKRGHGRPLWFPDTCEVYPGDVGFFERGQDGNFCRLFNVLVDEDDPLNRRGVPEGFTPLIISDRDVQYTPQAWPAGQCLKTTTVTSSEVTFKPLTSDLIPVDAGITYDCSKNLGALLLLRNNNVRVNLRSSRIIRDYIKGGIDSWYTFGWRDFAEEDLPENSLVLVRGCDISDSWALASFADRSLKANVFFNGGLIQSAGSTELRGSWNRHIESSAECREGSVLVTGHFRRRESEGSAIWDKLGMAGLPEAMKKCIDCLFVRVYRMRRRLMGFNIPTQIKAQAGPHSLPDRPPEDEPASALVAQHDVEIDIDSDVDLNIHPLDHLLDYVVKAAPDAQLAVVTDDDLYKLLPNESDLDNIGDVLNAKRPCIRMEDSSIALLDLALAEAVPSTITPAAQDLNSQKFETTSTNTTHTPNLPVPSSEFPSFIATRNTTSSTSDPSPQPGSGMASSRGIWAVLIGVGYTADEDPWSGSQHDVQLMHEYLLKRGTHPSQIKRLEDQEGTHDAIIQLITSHLINNPSIQQDDPILIYLSGYGTQISAPADWPINGSDRRVDAFVTYNSQLPEDHPAYEDVLLHRAIHALLQKLHSRHGNNITVVLESSHGWRDTEGYVVLKACDQTEIAEGNFRGGLFTAALIAALEEGDDITYNQLQQRIKWNYQTLWRSACDQLDHFLKKNPEFAKPFHGPRYPTIQTPQCVGSYEHRNRLLWNGFGSTRQTQTFSVERATNTPAGAMQCKISAGNNFGVQPGTIFEITMATRAEPVARTYTVIASTVEAVWCLCDLPADADFEPDNVQAVIVPSPIDPIKYHIEHTKSGRQADDGCILELRKIFAAHGQERNCVAVLEKSRDLAHCILLVDNEAVLIHRQDSLFTRHQIASPRVAFADVHQVFPEVFRSISRFYTFLNLENPSSQFTKEVDIKLHALLPVNTQIGWFGAEPLREAGKEIVFINDLATVPCSKEGLDHALVLTNTSDKDLFPYVFWFDTDTYSITLLYATQNEDDAPLRKFGAPPIPESEKPPLLEEEPSAVPMEPSSRHPQNDAVVNATSDASTLYSGLASPNVSSSHISRHPGNSSRARNPWAPALGPVFRRSPLARHTQYGSPRPEIFRSRKRPKTRRRRTPKASHLAEKSGATLISSDGRPYKGKDAKGSSYIVPEEEEDDEEEEIPSVPGVVQIGGSQDCGRPLIFCAPASMPRKVGFLKVFLADHPLDLNSLEQDAILGVNEEGQPNFLKHRTSLETPNDSFIRRCSSITKAVALIPEEAT